MAKNKAENNANAQFMAPPAGQGLGMPGFGFTAPAPSFMAPPTMAPPFGFAPPPTQGRAQGEERSRFDKDGKPKSKKQLKREAKIDKMSDRRRDKLAEKWEYKKYKFDVRQGMSGTGEYFYIMRRPASALMLIFFLLIVGLFAVSYLKIMPEYTSLFIVPDTTPEELRLPETVIGEDDEPEVVEYEDKSIYVSLLDPVFGFLKNNLKLELGASPYYDSVTTLVSNGMADKTAPMIIFVYPITLLAGVFVAVFGFVKCCISLQGRRLVRRFPLYGLALVLIAAVTLLGGVAALNAPLDESMAYNKATPFLTEAFSLPDDPAEALAVHAGYGMLALLGVSVFTLICGLAAKKKIPYDVFD